MNEQIPYWAKRSAATRRKLLLASGEPIRANVPTPPVDVTWHATIRVGLHSMLDGQTLARVLRVMATDIDGYILTWGMHDSVVQEKIRKHFVSDMVIHLQNEVPELQTPTFKCSWCASVGRTADAVINATYVPTRAKPRPTCAECLAALIERYGQTAILREPLGGITPQVADLLGKQEEKRQVRYEYNKLTKERRVQHARIYHYSRSNDVPDADQEVTPMAEWIDVVKPDGTPSSNLKQIRYDAENHVMDVRFQNGHYIYCYIDVHQEEVDAVLKAEHPGSVFAKTIRNSKQKVRRRDQSQWGQKS